MRGSDSPLLAELKLTAGLKLLAGLKPTAGPKLLAGRGVSRQVASSRAETLRIQHTDMTGSISARRTCFFASIEK
jgi:hypothetical protein